MSHFLANRDALIGQRVAIRWGTMEYVSDSEKLARWQSRPLNGGGFQSQGRGRKATVGSRATVVVGTAWLPRR